jgi:hypothetical protein
MDDSTVPQSDVALRSGALSVKPGALFVAMRIFVDGSYGKDANGDEWITLGGIAATDNAWSEFEGHWHTMLRNRYPIAPYIHMIELMDGEDPFDSVNGWNEEKLGNLIVEGIARLSWMDKAQSQMIACSFNKSARDRIIAEGHTVSDPIAALVTTVTQAAIVPYLANCAVHGVTAEPIYFFFDRNEPFFRLLKRAWLNGRTRPGHQADPNNPWDYLRDVDERDLPNTYALQAADMIAWAHTRNLPGHPPRRFSYLKDWLIKCVPSMRGEIDEEAMRKRI